VLGPAVVVVARDVAGVAAGDRARDPRERVPDGRRAPVLGDRALDLVRRGGGAPHEVRREHPRALRRLGRGGVVGLRGHPFTAPCMIPATSWRPATTNRAMSGITEMTTPAMI